MDPSHQLQAYRDAFRESSTRARQLVDSLTWQQFNWKPSEDSWSVAECVEHLNLVARKYVPAMEAAIAGAGRPASGPFRYGWVSRKFIDSMSPGTRPIKTGAAMTPAESEGSMSAFDKAAALEEFVTLTDRFVAIADRCEGLDLAAIKMRSPFLRILKLPVGAFLDALGQHALRHLDQAKRVTEAPLFPDVVDASRRV